MYWNGSAWQVGPFSLSTTHGATTGNTSAASSDAVALPNWATEANGTFTVQATATDKAGNTFTGASSTFTLDTTAPVVTLDSLSGSGGTDSTAPLFIATDNDAQINWHANENGSFDVRVNGSNCSNGTPVASGSYSSAPATVGTVLLAANLQSGDHMYRVCVTDAASNAGQSVDFHISYDTVDPTLTFTAPLGNLFSNSTSRSVTWTEADNAGGSGVVSRSIQRQSVAPVGNACPATGWTDDGLPFTSASPTNDSPLLNNTCYRWQGTDRDAAGNTSHVATSGTVLVDTVAPTVGWECSTTSATTGFAACSNPYGNPVWVRATVSDVGSGLAASINGKASLTDLDAVNSTCDTAAAGSASCVFVWFH